MSNMSNMSNISDNIENINERIETIPCEICNQQIDINNYTVHSQQCLERHEIQNRIRMNAINRRRELEITNQDNNNNNNNTFTAVNFNLYEALYNPFEPNIDYDIIEDTDNEDNNNEDNEITTIENTDNEDNIEEDDIEDINNEENNDEDNIDDDIDDNIDDDIDDNIDYDIDDEIEENIEENDIVDINNTSLNSYYDTLPEITNSNNTDSNIIEMFRNNIYYSRSIYLNLSLLNQFTNNNNQGNITNFSDIIRDINYSRIRRHEPINLSKVTVCDLNKDELNIDENGNPIECPVCYENLTEFNKEEKHQIENEKKPVKILCGHIFCDSCISKWFEKNDDCPICKRNLRELSKMNNNNYDDNVNNDDNDENNDDNIINTEYIDNMILDVN